MDLMHDIRAAARHIRARPSLLILPAAAVAQGLLLNAIVLAAATHAAAISQAARYVKFLFTLS